MKYDRLYNFISPVTGKLADYSQFPSLEEDYIVVGNNKNEAEISPILIDIRLNMMDMRYDIDSLKKKDISDVKFIIQTPDIKLPNAQALSGLDNGVLGNKDGTIEILQRVSGPTSSTDNNIARFDGTTGQVLKDSKVKIDNDGKLFANSLQVTNTLGNNTGFKAQSSMYSNVIYKMPTNGGLPTQMLTTLGVPDFDGEYRLYWSTPPGATNSTSLLELDNLNADLNYQLRWTTPPRQLKTKDPKDPDNPAPVYLPLIPLTIPVFSIPVFNPVAVGTPLGSVTPSPVSIDPEKGDINTPGNIDANNIKGNDGHFDGDLDIDGDADIDGDLSTQGDIDSAGDISADGSVSGESFDFQDLDDDSQEFVRVSAPENLDHNYQIELQDAEPIMQEQIQPPDQRILQTAWRRMRPSSELKMLENSSNIDMPVTKLMWTELLAQDPIHIDFVPATSTTNEKMIITYTGGSSNNITIPYAADLIFGTLNNIGGKFDGFTSKVQNHLIKIKTSFDYRESYSTSSIGIFNRYDNGYILNNVTDNLGDCDLKLQLKFDNNISDLLEYKKLNNTFKFYSNVEVNAPTSNYQIANKEYVDSKSGGITLLQTGTGLTGGPIISSGVISIANTGVLSGSYRFGNFNVNSQGQLINVSNGSPSLTTNRSISVWGNTTGTSLLSTFVTIDNNDNLIVPNTGIFSDININYSGSLIFSGSNLNKTTRIKANPNTSSNIIFTLPSNNNTGIMYNNGSGGLSWKSLGTFDFSGSTISSTDTTIYIQPTSSIFPSVTGTVRINGNLSTQDELITDTYLRLNRYLTSVSTPSNGGILYVDGNNKLYFKNVNGNYYIAG